MGVVVVVHRVTKSASNFGVAMLHLPASKSDRAIGEVY